MNATMSLEKTIHYSVMLDQVLSIISPQHGGTFIDCTFGGGGYSRAILKFPGTKVLAIDRDKLTQKYANILVKRFPTRFNFFVFVKKLVFQSLPPSYVPRTFLALWLRFFSQILNFQKLMVLFPD